MYQEKQLVSEDGEFRKYFEGLVNPLGHRAVLKEVRTLKDVSKIKHTLFVIPNET